MTVTTPATALSLSTVPTDFSTELFDLPIYKCDPSTLHVLSPTLMNDIEMVDPRPENETGLSLYGALCAPEHPLETEVMRQMASVYTTDVSFLSDHQLYVASLASASTFANSNKKTDENDNDNVANQKRKEEERKQKKVMRATTVYTVYDEWKEWKEMSHESFANTYMFLDGAWMPEQMLQFIQPHIRAFNSSAMWQQAMHLYNLLSPFLAIMLPILLMLIIPFASLLMLQQRCYSNNETEPTMNFWKEYMACVVASLRSGPPFFRVFTDFAGSDWKNRLYLIGSFFFYLFSMYGNAMVCISSYRNCDRIFAHLRQHWILLTEQINKLYKYLSFNALEQTHPAWKQFGQCIDQKLNTLRYYKEAIQKVFLDLSIPLPDMVSRATNNSSVENSVGGGGGWWSEWKAKWMRTFHAGPAMSLFYRIVHDKEYADGFQYACRFEAWTALLEKLAERVEQKELTAVKWTLASSPSSSSASSNKRAKHKKKTATATATTTTKRVRVQMKKMTFPPFLVPSSDTENEPEKRVYVRNSCNLSRNFLLSGTNASGKTTYMKTVLFNLIFAQQTGLGCFQKATLTPFSYFHCYLSIPDTSGRDSLFQAEARRCKEMLDVMDAHPSPANHFCIFDELFSGTNPAEAVVSAEGFLRYVAQHRNVRFLVSTHFVELCEQLNTHKEMQNHCMKQHRLCDGIGYERGGISVLHQLQYPSTILEWATNRSKPTSNGSTAVSIFKRTD